jgi:hypothetical protein
MAMVVLAAPVPAEKVQQHQQMLAEINGPRRAEYEASRQRAGLHERGFIQQSPDGGYLYISVWEGDDVPAGLEALLRDNSDFTRWFLQQIEEVHGMSADQGIPPLPEQVIDSAPGQATS